jgi:hypothetical protein
MSHFGLVCAPDLTSSIFSGKRPVTILDVFFHPFELHRQSL